ncbi:hypothetical protein [Microlunatus flavus]|uniref:hypothetical protein n=1 Tax=Microlunatus flavus TaxID=1036181 RepID=UPI00111407D5|nr:hypothetical protein [Microlunatus flavus]
MPSPLVVLLRNHQAGGRAAVDLFGRAASAQGARPWADGLRRLREEAREDLDFNEAVMRRLGVSSSPVQVAGTRLTERLGRLKPNGRLVRRSPLSDVVELEGLIATVHVKIAGWQAARTGDFLTAEERGRLDVLEARARTQAERLVEMHREAAADVLGGVRGPG